MEGVVKRRRGETSSVVYSEYDEQFQGFGIIAVILLILEICILEIKNPRLKQLSLFKKKVVNK